MLILLKHSLAFFFFHCGVFVSAKTQNLRSAADLLIFPQRTALILARKSPRNIRFHRIDDLSSIIPGRIFTVAFAVTCTKLETILSMLTLARYADSYISMLFPF